MIFSKRYVELKEIIPARKSFLEGMYADIRAKIESGEYDSSNHPDTIPYAREIADLERELEYEEMMPTFEVGDQISICGYSDVTPYEVIGVSKSGKTVTVREMKAELDPDWVPEWIPGGFSAICTNNSDQRWNIEPDENGTVRKISLRTIKCDPRFNHGSSVSFWVPVGRTAKISERPVLNHAKKFHDYNF